MELIPMKQNSVEATVPAVHRAGRISPFERMSRQEQRAIEAQNRAGRVEIHGLQVSEEVEHERTNIMTRIAVRAFEAQAVVEDAALRCEMRAVTLERQACEMEPGAIPQIVSLRQAGSMQRQELMDVFAQGLIGQVRRVSGW